MDKEYKEIFIIIIKELNHLLQKLLMKIVPGYCIKGGFKMGLGMAMGCCCFRMEINLKEVSNLEKQMEKEFIVQEIMSFQDYGNKEQN